MVQRPSEHGTESLSLSADWVRAVNGIGPRSDPLEFVWRVTSRAEGITCVSRTERWKA